MNLRRNQNQQVRKNEIHKATAQALDELDRYLPPGWKLTEGSVRVKNDKYHSWMPREDEKKIGREQWSIEVILEEFMEMDKNLPHSWKLRWGTVENKYKEFVIKRKNGEYGGYYITKKSEKKNIQDPETIAEMEDKNEMSTGGERMSGGEWNQDLEFI